jgi:hypothetical protein
VNCFRLRGSAGPSVALLLSVIIALAGFCSAQQSLSMSGRVVDRKRIVPSIGSVFAPLQTLYLYFQVYGAATDPQNGRPSLGTYVTILQGTKQVLESKPFELQEWAKGSKDVAAVTMAIPLRDLKRGEYVLQLHVRDEISDTNVFRRVPLMIR